MKSDLRFDMIKRIKRKNAFTLAELLIVVAIIAVLIAVAIPVFSTQLDKARRAVAMANARSAYTAASIGLMDWQAGGTAELTPSGNDQYIKAEIGQYMLANMSSLGITQYYGNINAPFHGNVMEVVSSVMNKAKTDAFVSYAKNRNNRLVVYVHPKTHDSIAGIMYESADGKYVVLMVYEATPDYEVGNYFINTSTKEITRG